MFGFDMDNTNLKKSRKKFFGLASALETAMACSDGSRYSVMIDAAVQLRNMLKDADMDLTRSEKVRVVKSITRAKVKAFMDGTPESYKTFKTLDTISNDVVELL